MRTRSALALFLSLISAVCGVAPLAAARPDHVVTTSSPAADVGAPIPVRSGLRLVEVDYDQPGIDTGEFVEIANFGETRHRLRRVALVLVNGTTSDEYRRVSLSGRLGPSRRVVVATPSMPVDPAARVLPLPLTRDNVQNGAPDAVVLVDVANAVVLDALSYEGAIDDAAIDGISGTVDLVQGSPVSEEDGNEVAASICRVRDRTDTEDDERDWSSCAPTPGAPNEPQAARR